MEEIDSLRKEITEIKKRNSKVEGDKAWETSWTRRIFLAISTYILIAILLKTTGDHMPLKDAIIPVVGYLISTVSLDVLKSLWLEKHKTSSTKPIPAKNS